MHYQSLFTYFRCCVLVGQMQTAILEIKGVFLRPKLTYGGNLNPADKYFPDRIIIECS